MTDKKDKALKLAQEAMGLIGADLVCEAAHHEKKDRHGIGDPCPIQARWHHTFDAIREALADSALDRMAENARELGLDYEPAQQEPVAWGIFHFGGKRDRKLYTTCDTREQAIAYIAHRHQPDDTNTFRAAPIYTSPQPASKPLTDEENLYDLAVRADNGGQP